MLMGQYHYLVLIDTNNIIDYLFASSKYKLIRGASMILDKLNRSITLALADQYRGTILSSSGGESRILFQEEETAEVFMSEVKAAYKKETDEVTLSIVKVIRNENEKIAEWLLRGEKELRRYELQAGKKERVGFTLSPIMKRCESCYKKVAEVSVNTPEGELKYCRSCAAKHDQVNQVQSQLKQFQQNEQSSFEINGLMEIHEKLISSVKNGNETTWVKNIAGLLNDENESSYIGFVYADGKNIGKLFRENLFKKLVDAEDEQFIEAYQKISSGLHQSMIDAAVETAKEYENQSVNVDYAMVGGDDFVAIMSGKYAVSYTNTLLSKFEEKTSENLGETQQIAAGVVIAKSSYPIHRLFDLSYQLMTRTKYNNPTSSLDFMILSDSTIQSVDGIRGDQVIGQRHLRAEGYSISNETEKGLSFNQLYETIVTLKKRGFPRSKIKDLYYLVLEQDEDMLTFLWIEWRSRLSREVKEALDHWNSRFYETPFPFVRHSSGEPTYFTPLLDLFDLYDFVDIEEEVNV